MGQWLKGTAGAKGTARTLDQHLEAAFGEDAPVQEANETGAAITGAYQDQRRVLYAARCIAVCQQNRPIGHRSRKIALYKDSVGFSGWQFAKSTDQTTYNGHRFLSPLLYGWLTAMVNRLLISSLLLLKKHALHKGHYISKHFSTVYLIKNLVLRCRVNMLLKAGLAQEFNHRTSGGNRDQRVQLAMNPQQREVPI